MSNLERLQARLRDQGVAALLVSDLANVQWLSDFSGSSGFVIVTPTDARFLTDSRYTIQAGEEVKNMRVESFASPKKSSEFIAENAQAMGIQELGFETSCIYATWEDWTKAMTGLRLVPTKDVLKPLRMVKTEDEVAKIRRAIGLTEACINHVRRAIQPGVTEFDLGLEIEFYFRKNGAEVGFSPIVASGPNSARPHAHPSDRKIEKGDFVTLDLGCRLEGYCSDITRTFVVGEASDRHREVYDQVLLALERSTQALLPGRQAKDVDGVAREVLKEKGLDGYFGHGLGHGLGRAVHDLGQLGPRSEDEIEAGQVWTVEPGVYIEGFGGVRIEDDVLVTPNGPEVLTSYPKELTIVG
ncbi:MAG: aminopeptidase P family protein [Fimbriimonadaceae bacterium]|nr:MAG: aminopeptidase P family protein [Fimbriimonadaceae bacterium]